MLPQNNPDRIRIAFDDHRLVANAGLLLPATLARHLGLRELADHHLDLGGRPGRAKRVDKMLTLVASVLAGGDCIDDADALRETVGRARYGGARGQLTVRADSGFYTHNVVSVCRKMDVRFSITIRQHKSLHNLIEAIPQDTWTPIPYWMDGAADVDETAYTPSRASPTPRRCGSSFGG